MSSCPGDGCLAKWLEWARGERQSAEASGPAQGGLFAGTAYEDTAPAIRDASEFRSAVETLAYSLFRLRNNRLTRAERPRLENLVENAIFKMDRHLQRSGAVLADADTAEFQELRHQVAEERRLAERRRVAAAGIRHRMEQIEKLTPEEFEEFVGEVFEALDFEVQHSGGSGDEGADLRLKRGPMRAVVQCKYYKKGVIGSPELQKFLGTIHQSGSQKGYFVTTSSFSLSAEKFVANQPIELIDGPRLAEMVRELIGADKPAKESPELPFF